MRDLWQKLPESQNDYFDSSFPQSPMFADQESKDKALRQFLGRCVLYFPSNRFEEPAWLNEENLSARAQHFDRRQLADHTDRKIISTSPLRNNQNWLYEVVYDRAAFELRTQDFNLPIGNTDTKLPLQIFSGFQGAATSMFDLSLQVIRALMGRDDVRFGIGTRHNRVLSLESESGPRVSNVFQLSSGESALLNLFLSVLRDYDLSGAAFSAATDVRGVVVVDEVDLHLHVRHQRTVLPTLMRMFPKVQFVVTTHSPLFVLGMRDHFGEDGFALYRLPEGQRIGTEEFGEFDGAYRALMETQRAQDEVRQAIESSRTPIVFVEGPTDKRYLEGAAAALGWEDIMQQVELRVGGSDSKLDAIWKTLTIAIRDALPIKVVLLYDCDARGKKGRGESANAGKVSRRFMPMQVDNPIATGIENLFPRDALQRARSENPELFEVTPEHYKEVGTEQRLVPEKWVLRSDTEKQALCDFVCSSGNSDDFGAFEQVLQIVVDAVG